MALPTKQQQFGGPQESESQAADDGAADGTGLPFTTRVADGGSGLPFTAGAPDGGSGLPFTTGVADGGSAGGGAAAGDGDDVGVGVAEIGGAPRVAVGLRQGLIVSVLHQHWPLQATWPGGQGALPCCGPTCARAPRVNSGATNAPASPSPSRFSRPRRV